MRHASTDKSVGDPPSFRLDDCATQRNLSAEGREDAQRLGAAFRARAIPIGRVLSSQWCRCLETARLAFGEPTPWPALNSTFRNRELEPERTREVRALAGERPSGGNLVLVTHQLNIAALTSVYPAEGELVVLSPLGGGRFRVAGRLQPDTLN
ncbi:MAG: histidine phosphatase family protein [Candidatus Rokuibacteriota bacterium]|nr:MAG: histidine phosphatase family protein [Candidatus Rokubacteria bacterium]